MLLVITHNLNKYNLTDFTMFEQEAPSAFEIIALKHAASGISVWVGIEDSNRIPRSLIFVE